MKKENKSLFMQKNHF